MSADTALTWTCHACGAERPDAKIAVYTRVLPIKDGGEATFSENIRYCTDNVACATKAQRITFLKDQPYMLAPAEPSRKSTLAARVRQRWFS